MEAASMLTPHTASTSTTGRLQANKSSRVEAPTARDDAFHHLGDHGLRGLLHGLLLHPRRRRQPVARGGNETAGPGRRGQHRDPRLLVLHAPLGAGIDQEGQPLRPEGRHGHAPSCSAARSCPSRSTSTPTSASRRRTPPSSRSSTPSPACTAPTSSSGSAAADRHDPLVPRPLTRPSSTRAWRCPGIYWHFVDIMWIVVYSTVYIL